MVLPKNVGVDNITLERLTDISIPCAICQEPITGRGYLFEISNKDEEAVMSFDELCFLQFYMVIYEFIKKNGIEIPDLFKPTKRVQ